MKRQFFWFLLLLMILIMFSGCGSSSGGDDNNNNTPTPPVNTDGEQYIIADHTIVEQYDEIPQQYIDIVKTYWVQLLGESHSEAYRDGLVLLEALDSRFQAEIQGNNDTNLPLGPTNEYLRMNRKRWSGSRWYHWGTGEDIFWTNQAEVEGIKANVTYCNTNNLPVRVVGFGWCWDMTRGEPSPEPDPVYGCRWYGSTDGESAGWWGLDEGDSVINCQTYCRQIDDYNEFCRQNDYTTDFIFTTGTVDGYIGESGYQGYLKNQYIRDYVKENGGILFDYADILCWNDDDELQETEWNEIKYPIIHPDNDAEDTGHISNAGATRLAKAMWWMLARIAGWDGR